MARESRGGLCGAGGCERVYEEGRGTDLVCKGPEVAVAAGNAHLSVGREGCANDKLLERGIEWRAMEDEGGPNLVHAVPDAAPVGHCADGDDVEVKEGCSGAALCETPVEGTLEGVEIGLGESEDVLGLCDLDGGGEEDGEVALELWEEEEWGGVEGVGVVEEVASEEAVEKGDELAGVKVVWCGFEEGEGEEVMVEEEGEEGGIDVGVDSEEFCAELEGEEGFFEVVSTEGMEGHE